MEILESKIQAQILKAAKREGISVREVKSILINRVRTGLRASR